MPASMRILETWVGISHNSLYRISKAMSRVTELLRNSIVWVHDVQVTAMWGQAVLGLCMEQKLSVGGG